MTTSTRALVAYYADLLILQYIGKARAYATIEATIAPVVMPQTSVQTITFAEAPASGSFVLSYDGVPTAAIDWNDSAASIQTELRTIPGLGDITVAGEIAGLVVTITFTGVTAPAELLELDSSTLNVDDPVLAETDLILPLAVQNGFNLTGSEIAVGAQLDVLGKYAGVSRSGLGFTQNITLDDDDFLSLIQMAIAKNSAGSSLYEIQALMHQFFPDQILIFDYQNMRMSYLISTAVGSQDLIQLFVTEGLLPAPMAVQVALIIYAPIITDFFGFRTYDAAAYNSSPFNTYADYQMDWPWLSYTNAISA